MSAPMTEAAFRRAFAEAYCGTGKVFETDATADAAVAAAKAAGVVFAPEAPALPGQIHWAIEYGKLRRAVEREITAILHHHTLQWPYRADALPLIVTRLTAALAEGAQP